MYHTASPTRQSLILLAPLAVAFLLVSVFLVTIDPHTPSVSMPAGPCATAPDPRLYVNPASHAAIAAGQLVAAGQSQTAEAIKCIARQPTALWLTESIAEVGSHTEAYVQAATANHQIPLLVAYNIPHRDCGNFSTGGAATGDDYRQWIGSIAQAIGGASAWIVLEPDALDQAVDCLDDSHQTERLTLLRDAVTTLKSHPTTKVYLDAGNASWMSADTLRPLLVQAGIAGADGFALNVSNYLTDQDTVAFGTELAGLLGGKHFVIDSSRNGKGPWRSNDPQAWCNPPQRALGVAPAFGPHDGLLDANFWVKQPGDSDGECRGGPAAGQWWQANALQLVRNS